jgi:hypothetical protein
MKTKKKELKDNNLKSAAILTIKDADKMTKKGRENIAKWLRRNANNLEELGKDYVGNFRSKYLYNEE